VAAQTLRLVTTILEDGGNDTWKDFCAIPIVKLGFPDFYKLSNSYCEPCTP
jgi:hypothetical protein